MHMGGRQEAELVPLPGDGLTGGDQRPAPSSGFHFVVSERGGEETSRGGQAHASVTILRRALFGGEAGGRMGAGLPLHLRFP